MSIYEFVYALFSLLLGLALTELLGGLGRTLKSRKAIRLGWLTPVLAAITAFELTGAWGAAWTARGDIHFSILTLISTLVITGVFYLAATQVFPDTPAEWRDLDDYYDQHKRWVVGGLFVGGLLVMAAQVSIGINPLPNVVMWAVQIVWTLLCAGLVTIRARRLNLVLLAAWLALDIGANVFNAINDPYLDNLPEKPAATAPANSS
jgi:hypothetical protein